MQLQRKGKLLCQLITEHEYLTKGDSLFSGEDMKAESVLRRCGYTVNAKDDLNDQQRQGILMQVVDTTASLLGTSRCTYAIEPPCTEPYAQWCERQGLFNPSYSIFGCGDVNKKRALSHPLHVA